MIHTYIPQYHLNNNNNERVLISDVIFQGEKVFITFPTYADLEVSMFKLKIDDFDYFIEGKILYKNELYAIEFEINNLFKYKFITIYDKNNKFIKKIFCKKNLTDDTAQLTAATLFKNDYECLYAWIEYHAIIGFDYFIIYYNGFINDIINRIKLVPLFETLNILLIEWPFSYWVDGYEMGIEGRLAKEGDNITNIVITKDYHHAQQMMLNHARILFGKSTEYIAFFDLDEYFVSFDSVHQESLKKLLIENDGDVYIFQSKWSEIENDILPTLETGVSFFKNKDIYTKDTWEEIPKYSKFIAKPNRLHEVSAHIPLICDENSKIYNVNPVIFGILHFHRFSGKASRRTLINPNNNWVKLDGKCSIYH